MVNRILYFFIKQAQILNRSIYVQHTLPILRLEPPPPRSSALLLDVLLLFSILFVEFIFHISYPIHARSRGFL